MVTRKNQRFVRYIWLAIIEIQEKLWVAISGIEILCLPQNCSNSAISNMGLMSTRLDRRDLIVAPIPENAHVFATSAIS
ncbi:MAG: hypothetical protein MJA27_11885 [Pseudanabaenales cyanobacterium]|nr:hypothetical protein [Pseudanabaenales cyanobacterium]